MTVAVPLKYLAAINRTVLDESTAPDYRFKYVDIGSVASDGSVTVLDEALLFSAAPSRARRIAPPGATAISTVRTYLRAIAHVPHSDDALVFSTGFAIAEPLDRVDHRYLYYACRSDPFVDEVVARSVGVSYPAINPSDLACIPVPVRELSEQRRIADFLDDQVARIDNIIRSRRLQRAALDEALTSRLSAIFLRDEMVPMRRLIREAAVGIVVQPAKYYVEPPEGVPALRGLNVREGAISTQDLVRISATGHFANPRSQLRLGDVVVVRTGDAGSACVVPDWAVGWNCIDLVIVRANASAVPAFLAHALNAARRDTGVAAAASGSIQQHFGVGALLNLPVPWADPRTQADLSRQADGAYVDATEGKAYLDRSVELLTELKRSLITAAVTSEFDVSSADGSRAPA